VSGEELDDLFADGEPPRRRRRGTVVVLVSALVLLLGGFSVVGGYLWSLNSKLDHNVKHDETFLPPDTVERPRPPRSDNDALNILLIGSDARTGSDADPDVTGARSDTIMLAHITAKRDQVYLVSFPRDSYVSIPGHGRNKINAAYAFGGPRLLVQTIEGLTGVRVDHIAEIGFEGFRDVTTALGGVDVEVAKASSIPGTPYRWSAGVNHMQGEEALQFVRQRYGLSGGDLDRVLRQQAFVKAIMLKALSRGTVTDPAKFSKVVEAGTRYLTVDAALTTKKLRSLAVSLRGVRGDDITFVTAPVAGFGRTSAGASIVRLDVAKLSELSNALRQDTMSGYRPH
jgi:LCP family protein required for cell wall assembly